MSQIEWAMWANEQAVASSSVLLLGSIIGIVGMFQNWAFGIYGLSASLLILALEWPRSKKKKGTTLERHFQRPLTIIVDKLGVFGRNYFVRFVLYLLLCVPCCFIIATLLGGICLLITSLIYFIAAMKGEEWKPTGLEGGQDINKKRPQSLHPPNKPPPRAPAPTDTSATGSSVDVTGISVSVLQTNNEVKFSKKSKKESKKEVKLSKDVNPADKKPSRVPPRPRAAARQGVQAKN